MSQMGRAKKREFITRLRLRNGNINATCKSLNMSRSSYYRWIAEDPVFKAQADEAIEDIVGENVDQVKDVILDLALKDRMFPACKYYLETNGLRLLQCEQRKQIEVQHSTLESDYEKIAMRKFIPDAMRTNTKE
jgi:hypothetical protein